jgi:2-polyprenyl-3-methyl-5-hydroxy-6-metoxy-1,4-benzoquinol methylase
MENKPRVTGFINDRLNGLGQFVSKAIGKTILDIGCNRGLISFEFARNGAALVHGCDHYRRGIRTARDIFEEVPTKSRFEIIDLSRGQEAIARAFGDDYLPTYDVVLYLGVHHHLRRSMSEESLGELVKHLAGRTGSTLIARTSALDHLSVVLRSTGLSMHSLNNDLPVVAPLSVWSR